MPTLTDRYVLSTDPTGNVRVYANVPQGRRFPDKVVELSPDAFDVSGRVVTLLRPQTLPQGAELSFSWGQQEVAPPPDPDPTPVATLTIPAGSVGSTLTDFVTRVDLSDLPASWWDSITQPDGREIRVRSAGADVPFDLVSINTTYRIGELFFKATLTTAEQAFTVEVVAGASAPAATDTIGRNAAWSGFDEVFIGDTTSRTGSGHDLALTGGAMFSDWLMEKISPNVSAHQGVCWDGGDFIVIGTNELVRYDASWNELARSNDPLGDTGHAGASRLNAGVLVGDELFILFGTATSTSHWIAVYDKTTFAFKREHSLVPAGTTEESGVGYDPAADEFYVCRYAVDNTTAFYRFDSSWNYLGAVTASQTLPWAQGIVVADGVVYVTSDIFWTGSRMLWRIFAVDPSTGTTTEVWRGTQGESLEGISADDDGNLYVLWDGTTGAEGDGVTSYVHKLTRAGSKWLCPGGLGYALASSVPVRTQWTVGASFVVGRRLPNGTNWTDQWQNPISYGVSGSSGTSRAVFQYDETGNVGGLYNSTDSWLGWAAGGASFPYEPGERHRIHHTQNGTTDRKLWSDGTLVATDAGVSQRPTAGANGLMLGAEDTAPSARERGQINYAYLRNGVLSADWIAAENESWETPSSFYAVA